MSNPFVPVTTAKLLWLEGKPYSVEFSDIYYSKENGLAEKHYVFLEGNELPARWKAMTQEFFCIGETGFGTGLNFLLTWSLWEQYAPPDSQLYYYSCEKFPLTRDDLQRCLLLWPQLHEFSTQLISAYPVLTPGFHYLSFAKGRVKLILMLGDVIESYRELLLCGDKQLEPAIRTTAIDAWYFDGFSPKKNLAMWSKELVTLIALLSKQGSTLATYTVASTVKTNLHEAGFTLEKRKGFGDKRSMLTACLNRPINSDKPRHTPWHVDCSRQYTHKKALIVGAGLAGCFTAHALANRGWQITLLEEAKTIAQGASGNTHAVLYPQFSAFRSPLTVFMLHAYLYALRVYKPLLESCKVGELSGIFQLAHNQKEQQNQYSLQRWLNHYPELAVLMNADEASAVCGIPLEQNGMHIPAAGWFDIPKLCNSLINHRNIDVRCSNRIAELHYFKKQWQAGEFHAETLILANGLQATRYPQTQCIPMKSIGGQLSFIKAQAQSSQLKIPLCATGHVLPGREGYHALGATYHLDVQTITSQPHDDKMNVDRLKALATPVNWSDEVLYSWCGIRAATPDYLPAVGAIPNTVLFTKLFASLADNSKRWLPQTGVYLPGLYSCAGFGSRGLTTIPLAAELLAGLLNGEPPIVSQSLMKSLSPARFLLKQIIRSGYHNKNIDA